MTSSIAGGPPTWVFGREGITIRLRRVEPLTIVIESSEDQVRTFQFPEIDELTAFQCGFERHLIDTGWSLVDFGPERRSGQRTRSGPERRRYPGAPSSSSG